MPTNYAEKVIELAQGGRGVEQPTADDWQKVERQLGLALPSDFKTVVSALGAGDFGCGLHLRNPCASSKYIVLSHEALVEHRELISDLEERCNLPLYPNPRGSVVVASVDRQDFLLRPDETGKRLTDLVWWDLDTEEVKELKLSISQFLHDLYLGLIREGWADELRRYFWRDGSLPFFDPWRGPSV